MGILLGVMVNESRACSQLGEWKGLEGMALEEEAGEAGEASQGVCRSIFVVLGLMAAVVPNEVPNEVPRQSRFLEPDSPTASCRLSPESESVVQGYQRSSSPLLPPTVPPTQYSPLVCRRWNLRWRYCISG